MPSKLKNLSPAQRNASALQQARMGSSFGQVPQQEFNPRGTHNEPDYYTYGRRREDGGMDQVGEFSAPGGGRGRLDLPRGTNFTATPYNDAIGRSGFGPDADNQASYNTRVRVKSPSGKTTRSFNRQGWIYDPGFGAKQAGRPLEMRTGSNGRGVYAGNTFEAQLNYQSGMNDNRSYMDPNSPAGSAENFRNRYRRQTAGFGR